MPRLGGNLSSMDTDQSCANLSATEFWFCGVLVFPPNPPLARCWLLRVPSVGSRGRLHTVAHQMPTNLSVAPVAIVDGTHLCLLPPHGDDADYAQHLGNDDDHATMTVPAVPLSLVYKLVGGEYISRSNLEDFVIEGGGCVDDNIQASDASSFIETICLRASDVVNSDFRFMHPVCLMAGSSTFPIHIVCDENGDASITWVAQSLYVCLPSLDGLSSDANGFDPGDDCTVYGDDCGVILEEYAHNNLMNSVSKPKQLHFEIHNGGSCLVADFLGVAGYDQAMVLPQVDSSLLTSLQRDAANSDQLIQQKQLLQTIITNSFIADGTGVLLSKSMMQYVLKTKVGKAFGLTLPVMETAQPLDTASVNEKLQQTTAINNEHSPAKNLPNKQSSAMQVDEQDAITPAWLEAIEQTVEHRLAKEVAESSQLEKTIQVCSALLSRGKCTLHKATRLTINTEDNRVEPEIIRLRYGTRPRTSMDTIGVSVVLDLELDVCLPKYTSYDADGKEQQSIVLHDFHVSCSLVQKDQSSPATITKVRTVSGVVPTFHSGDCITILSSVYLSNVEINLHNNNPTVEISIQGLWVDGLLNKSYWNPVEKKDRKGGVLCVTRLPEEIFLLSPTPTSLASQSGRWIQHEIDFVSGPSNDLVPSVIFECRRPRTLSVDTSSCGANDANTWRDLVLKLNASIGDNSFIDLYWRKGEPQLKLVIFSSNAEERAATVKLVLRHLPESSKLIEEDPNEQEYTKALLQSMKNEAEALKRHRSLLSSKEATADVHTEMAALQCSTDGIASLLKRGWD